MEGVGASLTDSAAWLMKTKLDGASRSALINDLFGNSGANLNYIRLPLSATDISTGFFTHDDIEYPGTDPKLQNFQLNTEHDFNLPLLHAMKNANPNFRLMGTAWSAPGWLKTGNNLTNATTLGLIGGTLNESLTDVYAAYLAKLITAYEIRDIPFDAITMQNEPAFSPGNYPGMLLSAGQEASLALATGLVFKQKGIKTKILVHDHNWDIAQRALDILNDTAAYPYIFGVAFHCYGGDVSAQTTVKNAYPDKQIYFTECSGVFSSGTFSSNLMWDTNTLVIGATRNWARTVLLWSLALDENGQPNIGGCQDCRGVVTINSVTGEITRNEEYYSLAHYGRVVNRGAFRINSTASFGSVQSVAFINPDQSRALILTNSAITASVVTVQEGNKVFTYTLPPLSVASFSWMPASSIAGSNLT